MAFTPENVISLLGLSIQGDLGPFTAYTSRRGKKVIFPKAPPLEPPSFRQQLFRQKFVTFGIEWASLSDDQRAAWKLAALHCDATMTGPGLMMWWLTTRDTRQLQNLIRRSGVTTLDLGIVP